MKKVVLFVFMLLQLWACGQVKYREVLSLADEFVSSLETDYQSYGLLGGVDKIRYTRDGLAHQCENRQHGLRRRLRAIATSLGFSLLRRWTSEASVSVLCRYDNDRLSQLI